uniref:Auxin response factor n=1 Tax=Solanum chacoense TaxID=4108 RepID=A0A0V0IRJ8_SOLCH
MKEVLEKCVDSQLWHACAGGMVQIPPVNSKVYYFPQGHAEHTLMNVDFSALPRSPALILCRVAAVKFLADPETDEVYAKIRVVPVGNKGNDFDDDDDILASNESGTTEKPNSFAKTLTQSDANNGGGFSVPRYCAETIFPRLDYTADPPVQTVTAKDVHGETWKFRHIYRGTPRRHLLTTGWSSFVNQKKLVAGDSIVFLRAENGELYVGIRRAKRGGIGGPEAPSGWNSGAGNYGGFSAFLREEMSKNGNLSSPTGSLRGKVRVRPESVVEAAYLAASGQPFEVVYYPCANTPEFCVRASSVNTAMRTQWCSGMRFKMAFETEDSSRISWFMGTISSIQLADPIRWPNSPWRLLQVAWDEPDLLQNVKHVSPWLVELVSNMPVIHPSPFSPPRKKLRLPPDFSLDSQFQLPFFSGNPLRSSSPFCCLSDNITAGIQGARHVQFGVPLLNLHRSEKLQLGVLQPPASQPVDADSEIPIGTSKVQKESNENVSCLLTMGTSSQMEEADNVKTPRFLLFGQPILTEQQMSSVLSTHAPPQVQAERDSDWAQLKTERISQGWKCLSESLSSTTFLWNKGYHAAELGTSTDHCKVFLDSEDVGHTLDLSVLGSYAELYKRLADMFEMERLDMVTRVLYLDATGASKQIGDEPFSDFIKTAKRLTILKKSGNNATRKWLTDLPILNVV